MTLSRTLVLLPLLAWPALACAQDLSGTYVLEGHEGITNKKSNRTTTRLALEAKPGGVYKVSRRHTYTQDGVQSSTFTGTGWIDGDELKLVYTSSSGFLDALSDAHVNLPLLEGKYEIDGDELKGWSHSLDRKDRKSTYRESGKRQGAPVTEEPESDDPSPAGSIGGLIPDGVYLAGQVIELEALEAFGVMGPATLNDAKLTLTGPGEVTVRASVAGEVVETTIRAVEARVVSVEVLDSLPIYRTEPPHWAEATGDAQEPTGAPALLTMKQPLKLRVVLKAEADLSEPARVILSGRHKSVRLQARTQLDSLSGGQAVELSTEGPISDGVRVNELDLSWTVQGVVSKAKTRAGKTSLRIYTTLAAPRTNRIPRHPDAQPVTTQLHLEMATEWAKGAGENIARGKGKSIAHTIDNEFRHFVHPLDYANNPRAIPEYRRDASSSTGWVAKPANYGELPSETGGYISNGRRMVSSIYYPGEDYNEFYRQNYGWYVLENPDKVGGRCNQQASLIADILGTVGIEAKIYYIQRVGSGKTTGRSMLRYYVSNVSGKSWNFHGVCRAILADGQPWFYDGSGSGPPSRINGKPEDLLGIDGTFVNYWKPYWKYHSKKAGETTRLVPQSDWPTRYIGNTGKLAKGQWKGVPIQEGEKPLLPGQANN